MQRCPAAGQPLTSLRAQAVAAPAAAKALPPHAAVVTRRTALAAALFSGAPVCSTLTALREVPAAKSSPGAELTRDRRPRGGGQGERQGLHPLAGEHGRQPGRVLVRVRRCVRHGRSAAFPVCEALGLCHCCAKWSPTSHLRRHQEARHHRRRAQEAPGGDPARHRPHRRRSQVMLQAGRAAFSESTARYRVPYCKLLRQGRVAWAE